MNGATKNDQVEVGGFTADVLIVGAGAAGLTLAIELARRGISFRLVDKLAGPFLGSRGKGLQPRSLEVFEDMGVLDRLAARGGAYPVQRHYRDDGTHDDELLVEAGPPTAAEPYASPLMVPQFATETVLRERLVELGAAPRYRTELRAFTQDAHGVEARLVEPAGEAVVRTRYLVGTDGGQSPVRHMLAIPFPGQTLGVRAIVADVLLEGLTREVWHRFHEGPSQIAICPLAGTDLFQIQAPVPLEGDIDVSAEGLAAMVAARTGRTSIVVRSVSWASVYSMNARLADRYRDGRVFLAGDAAHVHPPTGGQGLNTSVQDAYNLGWKLAAVLRGAPEALLATYEDERRPTAAHMLGLTTKLLDAAKQGDMRRGREVHQLDVGYPGSSLAMEAPERHGGVLAGDRAPDAPLQGAGGMPVRLFTLLQGTHWTLLAFGVEAIPLAPRPGLHLHRVGPRGDILDEKGHFRSAYGVGEGDCVLVRPDGYVGAIVSLENAGALEPYLERVIPSLPV